jgi:hypothetical protein
MTAHRVSCALALGALTGCSRSDAPPPPLSEPAASAASAAPATSGPDRPSAVAAGEICSIESEKSWGKGANGRTGITLTRGSEGRIALGVAFGNRPHAVVFDREGKGTLLKIPTKDGSELAKSIPAAEGKRDLQRVTPYWEGGELRALVDYRDKYESKRRRISCGPSTYDEPALLFDGSSRFEGDEKKADKPKGPDRAKLAAAPPASGAGEPPHAVPRLRLPGARSLLPGRSAADAGAQPVTKPPPDEKPDDKPDEKKKDKVRELRDCRSFVDSSSGAAWGVGSQLIGEAGDEEGELVWTMSFFALHQGAQVPLYASKLEKNATAAHTLEAPVAARLGDGWVLTGRYRGTLVGWVLDAGMRPRGSMRRYNAHPGLLRMVEDRDGLLLTVAQTKAENRFAPRAVRVAEDAKSLPASLLDVTVQGPEPSIAEPSFARAGSQGWLAVHAGPRRRARLTLVPVDDDLRSKGDRFFELTGKGDSVYESYLLALDGERLLLVYILNMDGGGSELQSRVLRCKV